MAKYCAMKSLIPSPGRRTWRKKSGICWQCCGDDFDGELPLFGFVPPVQDGRARCSDEMPMPDSSHCSQCGALLPADCPKGLCPQCGLEQALDLSGDESQLRSEGEASAAEPLNPQPAEANGARGEGRSFGDYELLEEIARGGMGVVYKARQRKLNRIVAIYETGECDGQHYFSMDYVPGRNLAEFVRDGPLPAQRAARYVKIIAEAIHYAHQHGTLHRDLKPSNVLIDVDDQPRITDFGLAKRLRGDFGLTVTGQMMGSPNFMPPEQCGWGST